MVDFAQSGADLAIRYGHGAWRDLHYEKFLTGEYFMVCAPRLLSDPYPLKALADLPYHILLHDQMREDWQMCLEHASVTAAPSRRMGFSHSNMVFDAAIDGLGLALKRSIMVANGQAPAGWSNLPTCR